MLFFFILIFLALYISPVSGYKLFVITLPDNYGKLKNEKVFYIGAAEPAFGIIYNLKPPEKFFLLAPNNKKSKLTLIRTEYEDKALNVKRRGYKIQVIPKVKGDYYICIESDYFLTKESKLIKIFTKVPFHVETEKGWDNLCGFNLEIKPYTRPYGFQEKGIFWGQVWYKNKPLENGTVEIERFSPIFLSLEDLPKDSYGEINYPYLRKTVKITKNGFFVISLEEPGWWVITIKKKAGIKAYGNNFYPLEIINHFWIYVYPLEERYLKYEYITH